VQPQLRDLRQSRTRQRFEHSMLCASCSVTLLGIGLGCHRSVTLSDPAGQRGGGGARVLMVTNLNWC
jgi:hypothetical protein